MTITVDFNWFINVLLRDDDYIQISIEYAEIIRELDKDELFTHIQFTSYDGATVYRSPYLWRIKAYRASLDKWLHDKAASEQRRREWCLMNENKSRMIKRMRIVSGISDDNIFERLARKISAEKMEEIFKVMGADFEK